MPPADKLRAVLVVTSRVENTFKIRTDDPRYQQLVEATCVDRKSALEWAGIPQPQPGEFLPEDIQSVFDSYRSGIKDPKTGEELYRVPDGEQESILKGLDIDDREVSNHIADTIEAKVEGARLTMGFESRA